MPEKTLSVPVQYVLHASARTFARPYELIAGLKNTFELWLNVAALPQENHWRVVLEAQVTGATPDGTVRMLTGCAIEAIVVVAGLSDEEAQQAVRLIAAPSVLGSIRTQLATLTQGTGLGTVLLPPMSAEHIAALPPKTET